MKHIARWALAGALTLSLVGVATAQKKLKMATIAPGTSAYLTMSTMATVVNKARDDVEITVDATGAATKHIVNMAEGKLDMVMTSPTVFFLMQNQKAMYKKLSKAPELSKKVRLVFWFPYGAYHVLSYAEDGMTSLEDIRGKKVFLGPPGGGAWNAAKQWIQAQTGMEPGKDYENFKGSWSSAFQAFQDKQVDVYVNGGIPPFPQVEQLAATSKLTILGPTKADVDKMTEEQLKPTKARGRSLDVIPAGAYGDGVSNTEDVYTLGAVVGVVAREDLDEETVYQVTKTFWEEAEKMRGNAPWLEKVTLDYAVREGGVALHPGAQRFYKEIGLEIPAGSMAP